MEHINKKKYVSYWITSFLLDYTLTIRNLSNNTRKSYRDCFKLLLPYLSKLCKKKIEEMFLTDFNQKNILSFLNYLEYDRKCTVKTRNQRLAAIYAFIHYILVNCPEYAEWARLIHNIPMKKEKIEIVNGRIKLRINYLEKNEMSTLLAAADRNTSQGQRDYALLLFLYNTGARASEATSLTIGNLLIDNQHVDPQAIIYGKGNKQRTCPLWKRTMDILKPLIDGREPSEKVFLNRYGNQITRFGVYEMVSRNVSKAVQKMPSLANKRISPHTIRHSTASHLLEAGVDINTIRAWLGHVSVNTTNIYAEVNMQMKANALKTCEIKDNQRGKKIWKSNQKLMDILSKI